MQLRAASRHRSQSTAMTTTSVGEDVNLLFRMLDARPLRKALAGTGAELALAVSRYVHDSLVIQHPSRVDPALFRPIIARVKRTRVSAWIYVPGQQPP